MPPKQGHPLSDERQPFPIGGYPAPINRGRVPPSVISSIGLQSVYDRSLGRTSFTLVLLAIAGGMALVLGMVGIFGVIWYWFPSHARIGIRLALGAPLQGLTAMFVRHGLLLSAIGAACGLTAALALTRLMKSLLQRQTRPILSRLPPSPRH